MKQNKISLLMLLLLASMVAVAQRPQYKMGMNVSSGFKPQVLLELHDSAQALLLTRVRTPENVFGSNAYRGMIVFDSIAKQLAYYDGTAWKYPLTDVTASQNIYNTDGTLLGNRTVTMGANTLAFNGTGLYTISSPFTMSNRTLKFTALANAGIVAADSVVVVATDGTIKKRDSRTFGSPTDSSIYGFDGVLKADRTVTKGTNYLRFIGSVGDTVSFGSDGRVGIGGITNDAKLHVFGFTNLQGDVTRILSQNENAPIRFEFYKKATRIPFNKGSLSARIGYNGVDSVLEVYNIMNSDLRFGTNDVERIRILSTGKVGVGTANPISAFQVSGAVRADSLVLQKLARNTSMTATDSFLMIDNIGIVKKIAAGNATVNNIYSTDGVLTGARTVTMGTNTLAFNGTGLYTISSPFTMSNGTLKFTALANAGIVAADSVVVVATDGTIKKRDARTFGSPTDSSIYGYNGTLRTNRIVTMNNNNLTFNSANGNFIFNPTGTGKVGIGTTTPASTLDIEGRVQIYPDGGLVTGNTDPILRFVATGWNRIVGQGSLAFFVNNNGTTTANATNVSMLINTAGNVGIGTTNPAYRLDIRDGNTYTDTIVTMALKLVDASGKFNGYGMSGNWGITTVSDEKLKENIKPYSGPSALKGINNINIVEYDWKALKPGNPNRHMPIGVIAQNIQKIFPDAVEFDSKSGNLTLRTTLFSFYLIKATQELNQEVDVLKKENKELNQGVDVLKKENQDLKQRVEKLEKMMSQMIKQ